MTTQANGSLPIITIVGFARNGNMSSFSISKAKAQSIFRLSILKKQNLLMSRMLQFWNS